MCWKTAGPPVVRHTGNRGYGETGLATCAERCCRMLRSFDTDPNGLSQANGNLYRATPLWLCGGTRTGFFKWTGPPHKGPHAPHRMCQRARHSRTRSEHGGEEGSSSIRRMHSAHEPSGCGAAGTRSVLPAICPTQPSCIQPGTMMGQGQSHSPIHFPDGTARTCDSFAHIWGGIIRRRFFEPPGRGGERRTAVGVALPAAISPAGGRGGPGWCAGCTPPLEGQPERRSLRCRPGALPE